MKQFLRSGALVWLCMFALLGCREMTTVDRTYQHVVINDFSAPFVTLLPPFDGTPNTLTLRVSGTITRPVILWVSELNPGQGRLVRSDTLAAGTYTDKRFGGDYYSNRTTELMVTSTPGTTGSLTIEWYLR